MRELRLPADRIQLHEQEFRGQVSAMKTNKKLLRDGGQDADCELTGLPWAPAAKQSEIVYNAHIRGGKFTH